jgi:hypothetical protein
MPTELLPHPQARRHPNYKLQLAVPADLRQHFNGLRHIRT